jgi:hypothetical protein
MKLVLLSGKSNSGKDYVGKILQDYLSDIRDSFIQNYAHIPIDDIVDLKGNTIYNVHHLSLAEPVKQIAKDYFDWNGEKDTYGRDLLINIGTYIGKDFATKKLYEYLGKDEKVITQLYKDFCKLLKPSVNLWSSILKDKILYLNQKCKNKENIFITTDNRFKDEILYQKLTFKDDIVSIRVKENHRTNYIDDISETDLDNYKFDYYIDNSKDNDDNYVLEQLKEIIK